MVRPTAAAKAAPVAHAIAFAPVTRETLSAQIRTQILERISSGALGPGSQVPSERTLSEQFGVARTSVREAMQGLLSLGVVVRRGNRTYVAEQLPDVTFDGIDNRKQYVEQLFETRRLLEVAMIELATLRATDTERREISGLADRFRRNMTTTAFRDLDREFHTSLSVACGNPLLAEIYGKVMARLFESEAVQALLVDAAHRDGVRKIVADAADQHQRLAAAVSTGNAEVAVAQAVAHLETVKCSLIDRLL